MLPHQTGLLPSRQSVNVVLVFEWDYCRCVRVGLLRHHVEMASHHVGKRILPEQVVMAMCCPDELTSCRANKSSL